MVVVVIGDEELHRIVREERFKLTVELSCERLVVRHHERRAAVIGNHMRDRKCLPRASGSEQDLSLVPAGEALAEFDDRRGLVAGRGVG